MDVRILIISSNGGTRSRISRAGQLLNVSHTCWGHHIVSQNPPVCGAHQRTEVMDVAGHSSCCHWISLGYLLRVGVVHNVASKMTAGVGQGREEPVYLLVPHLGVVTLPTRQTDL